MYQELSTFYERFGNGEVFWIPRDTFLQVMERTFTSASQPTLTRDIDYLSQLKPRPRGFDHIKYQRGFSWECARVLWVFRTLVEYSNYTQAIKRIKQTMENIYERSSEESGAGSQWSNEQQPSVTVSATEVSAS